jgi:hypothetical protein
MTKQEVEVATIPAPMVGKGYVRFYHVHQPAQQGVWVCDECYKPVRTFRQGNKYLEQHVKHAHGWKG